jgi:hypothetical protein
LLGQYFQIWPGMNGGELLGFEYRSNAWAYNALGVAKTSFTADTDTCVYPDRVMVLGTKLKYFEAKGFDTTALYRDYLAELETAMAQDMAAANLSFAPRPGTVLIGSQTACSAHDGQRGVVARPCRRLERTRCAGKHGPDGRRVLGEYVSKRIQR